MPIETILGSTKLTEFADNNSKSDEDGRNFYKRVKTLWEKDKLLVTSNFSFSHSVFKRLVLQICKNTPRACLGIGKLKPLSITPVLQLIPEGKDVFGNMVQKEENADNQLFLLFPQCYLPSF